MSIRTFDDLIGKTMVSVTGKKSDEEMIFDAGQVGRWRFFHQQDCCEGVTIEDVCGDITDLIGTPITLAEEVSNEDAPALSHESYTWTFYRFGTSRGEVWVRWLGTSNGYYSEAVDFGAIG